MVETSDKYPWQSSYPENIKWDSNIEPKPVSDILSNAVSKYSHKTAIDFLGQHYTYSQIGGYVDALAGNLQNLGIKSGTKVAIILPNCPQFIISYYAVLKIGAIVVNCNPLYTIHELEHQLDDADVEIIITLDLKIIYDKILQLRKSQKIKKILVTEGQILTPGQQLVDFEEIPS